jgi:hypothetical protein
MAFMVNDHNSCYLDSSIVGLFLSENYFFDKITWNMDKELWEKILKMSYKSYNPICTAYKDNEDTSITSRTLIKEKLKNIVTSLRDHRPDIDINSERNTLRTELFNCTNYIQNTAAIYNPFGIIRIILQNFNIRKNRVIDTKRKISKDEHVFVKDHDSKIFVTKVQHKNHDGGIKFVNKYNELKEVENSRVIGDVYFEKNCSNYFDLTSEKNFITEVGETIITTKQKSRNENENIKISLDTIKDFPFFIINKENHDEIDEIKEIIFDNKYDLSAVIFISSHVTCYVKKEKRWLYYNDTEKEKNYVDFDFKDIKKAINKKCVVLVYKYTNDYTEKLRKNNELIWFNNYIKKLEVSDIDFQLLLAGRKMDNDLLLEGKDDDEKKKLATDRLKDILEYDFKRIKPVYSAPDILKSPFAIEVPEKFRKKVSDLKTDIGIENELTSWLNNIERSPSPEEIIFFGSESVDSSIPTVVLSEESKPTESVEGHIVRATEEAIKYADGVTGDKFGEGQRVEARFGGKSRFYKGKVTKVNDDGTYVIQYDDGDKELKVKPSLIKKEVETTSGLDVHASPPKGDDAILVAAGFRPTESVPSSVVKESLKQIESVDSSSVAPKKNDNLSRAIESVDSSSSNSETKSIKTIEPHFVVLILTFICLFCMFVFTIYLRFYLQKPKLFISDTQITSNAKISKSVFNILLAEIISFAVFVLMMSTNYLEKIEWFTVIFCFGINSWLCYMCFQVQKETLNVSFANEFPNTILMLQISLLVVCLMIQMKYILQMMFKII